MYFESDVRRELYVNE
jgi:hypothetical protein